MKQVKLPDALYEKIEKKMAEMGFTTADEFVAYVLTQVLEDEAPQKELSAADEAEVKKRLKSLGYF